MFTTILEEADITFCSGINTKLIAPIPAVYKVQEGKGGEGGRDLGVP